MTRAKIRRGKRRLQMEIAGHAGYAPAGQDIVCAAVSILVQALIYTADDVRYDMTGGMISGIDMSATRRNTAMLDMVEAGLGMLEEAYPEHVRLLPDDEMAIRGDPNA